MTSKDEFVLEGSGKIVHELLEFQELEFRARALLDAMWTADVQVPDGKEGDAVHAAYTALAEMVEWEKPA